LTSRFIRCELRPICRAPDTPNVKNSALALSPAFLRNGPMATAQAPNAPILKINYSFLSFTFSFLLLFFVCFFSFFLHFFFILLPIQKEFLWS